jgi:hypothetical protein
VIMFPPRKRHGRLTHDILCSGRPQSNSTNTLRDREAAFHSRPVQLEQIFRDGSGGKSPRFLLAKPSATAIWHTEQARPGRFERQAQRRAEIHLALSFPAIECLANTVPSAAMREGWKENGICSSLKRTPRAKPVNLSSMVVKR